MGQDPGSSRLSFKYLPPASLQANPRNERTHTKAQIRQIAKSIREFGFVNPIILDDEGVVLAGHARLAAASLAGLQTVPTVRASGLTEAEKRAYVLADNKLADKAGWDRELLSAELGDLAVLLPQIDLDLTLTGFEPPEIDALFTDRGPAKAGPGEDLPVMPSSVCTRHGDLWCLGPHRLLHGDARSAGDVDRLMAGRQARMTFTDPPFNVPVVGHVRGRGRAKHREFAIASGEMSGPQYRAFLQECLGHVTPVSHDGAIVFVCVDWRHMVDLHAAGDAAFTELKNVVVWNKTSPGQGSFYRSQHELIFVFKVGRAEHINAFGLGAHGRARSMCGHTLA